MKFQNNLKDEKIQCQICPRKCILSEGQEGFCHVRKNINGKIELTSSENIHQSPHREE